MIPADIPLPSLACAAAIAIAVHWPAPAASAAESAAGSPTLVLVTGAGGEETFARQFESQTSAWREAGTTAGARIREAGSGAEDPEKPDRDVLRDLLAAEPADGDAPLWIVLTGHGTWDGKEARFNLRGPDVSDAELADWLKPVTRPVVLIVTGSSGAPFLNRVTAPGRIVVTATRSGNERNYARFGEHLAAVLSDPAGDLDSDGAVSLLEAFLSAAHRTREFYQSEGRLLTEHALIEDNGDAMGTPAEWFTGLRAVRESGDGTPLDGDRARRTFLVPPAADQALSPEDLARRESLENQVAALREIKDTFPEDEYYARLEPLFVELARLQQNAADPGAPPPPKSSEP